MSFDMRCFTTLALHSFATITSSPMTQLFFVVTYEISVLCVQLKLHCITATTLKGRTLQAALGAHNHSLHQLSASLPMYLLLLPAQLSLPHLHGDILLLLITHTRSHMPLITPLVRRDDQLLCNQARTLLGSNNYTPPSDHATLLPIAHELQRQIHQLGFDWHNDTQHVAMRQKQWPLNLLHWPTPPVDFLHACRPHNLQVVGGDSGSATDP